MQLSVGVYCLCRRAAKPPSVKIHRASNAEVKSATRVFNRDTGEDVMPQDLKMYQEYADKRVCLETEEVADIKRFDVQGQITKEWWIVVRIVRNGRAFFAAIGQTDESLQFKLDSICLPMFLHCCFLVSDRVDHYHISSLVILTWRKALAV